MARKGYLVLFPRFQEVNRSRAADATDLSVALLKDAFQSLKDDPEARPDPARVALVGHLAGAPIALNLAVRAEKEGLPVPKLVLGAMPGGIASDAKSRGILLDDLKDLNSSTLLIMMSGDREHLAADRTGRRILKEASEIPANRKLFVRVQSDSHGYPPLTATLVSPAAPNPAYDGGAIQLPPDPPRDPKQRPPAFKWTADMALSGEQTVLTAQLANNATDTLDYFGFWKTLEMAAEAAFAGRDAASLRADPKFVDMGSWSDGWPVKRLQAETPKAEGQEEAKPPAGPRRRL
jgi:pimeloyl-ACP methyl ester carboxylesterase